MNDLKYKVNYISIFIIIFVLASCRSKVASNYDKDSYNEFTSQKIEQYFDSVLTGFISSSDIQVYEKTIVENMSYLYGEFDLKEDLLSIG